MNLAFALDGRSYEIDLSDSNPERLREALAPFIKAARRSGSAGSGTSRSRRTSNRLSEISAILAWAKDNGFTASDRGRVPARVLEAHKAAH